MYTLIQCPRRSLWPTSNLTSPSGTKKTTNFTYLSSQCPLMWTFHNGTLTRQTNMHTFPQTSHTSTQQSQLLKLAALATFQQTTRRIWPHSTSFALQASSSQRSSKTSPASAFTHLITSGCVEMILSLLPHHISLHHSSLTLRVSSSAAVSIAVRAQGPIVPVLFMFKWFIFHFRPPLLELDFCKSALSVVLVGFIHGSQLSGWFLVENQFIIKCYVLK